MKIITKTEKLEIILAIASSCQISNIKVLKIIENEKEIDIYFNRKLKLHDLKNINNYFNIDYKDKELNYKLTFNVENKNLKLKILSLDELVDENKYNEFLYKFYLRIEKYKELINTILLNEDIEINNYVFYFIPYNKKYVGYANGDLNNDYCLKSYNFKQPENAYILRGTETDAKILTLRRNYNSKLNITWKYILSGSLVNMH